MSSIYHDATLLITGASSGIGKSIAKEVAFYQPKTLVLVARRADRLEALAAELKQHHPNVTCLVETCDIASMQSIDALLERLQKKNISIDILVNNAGLGDMGVFDKAPWEKIAQLLQVNIYALTYLTHRLLPAMIEKNYGGILNISSSYGLTFTPAFSTYIATKHFVTSFSECLRLDLADTAVRVTQICPGPVHTEFIDHIGNFTGQKAPKLVEISSERCARIAIHAFEKNRALVIPGVAIKILMFLASITPRFLLRWVYTPIARYARRRQLSHKPT